MKYFFLIIFLFSWCVLALSSTTDAQEVFDRKKVLKIAVNKKDERIVDKMAIKLCDEGFFCPGSVDLNYYFINLDNIKSNVEQVEVHDDESYWRAIQWDQDYDWWDWNTIYGIVESVIDCNYNIMGEDGRSVGIWSFSYVYILPTLKGSATFLMRPDIVNPIKEFAKSDRNNGAVNIKTINKNGIVGRLGLSTARDLPSWMEDLHKKDYNFGKLLKEIYFNTDKGDYTIKLYSSDGNESDCEAIIINRSDGLKCKLDGLRDYKVWIDSPDFYQGEYAEIGCIDVSWPGVGEFTILDDDLYGAFNIIKQKHPDVGKAFYVKSQESNCRLTRDGYLMKK